jgi:hypothetical protein
LEGRETNALIFGKSITGLSAGLSALGDDFLRVPR